MVPVRVETAIEGLSLGSGSRPGGSAPLAEPGSERRWQQLQQLRRGQLALEPLIAGLTSGTVPPDADVLAALWGQLDRHTVEELLASVAALDAEPWQQASRRELPSIASHPTVETAWLEPLLEWQQQAPANQQLAWLEVLAQFQDPRVAQRLRRVVLETSRRVTGHAEPDTSGTIEAVMLLLPLLGRQRQRQDAVLLLQCSLDPGPLAWRRAALEGVAVGLSAWPLPWLIPALQRLASDLSPALASQAIDLLARLPGGQRPLHQLATRRLDPAVASRLRRRLLHTPLLLVVHGRQGGEIPAVYQELADALQKRRRAPVLVQALTGATPKADIRLWQAASRTGGLTMVPLLLLPGDHVRRDLPVIAASWRAALAAGPLDAPLPKLRRLPFLGAWPHWQQLLAQQFQQQAAGRPWLWLHHPLRGPLAERYLRHLAARLGRPGRPATDPQPPTEPSESSDEPTLLAPLSLAPNRLSASLKMEPSAPSREVLPPLLELPPVREFLLSALEALP